MEIKQMEQWVLSLCEREGWANTPSTDLNKVMEEVGEVSREIRRYHDGRQRPDEQDEVAKDVIVNEIANEIGDVLFPLIKIANYYGLSLEDCFLAHKGKMEKRYATEKQPPEEEK